MSELELKILGQKLVVKSTKDEDYIRGVASYLNDKVEEVRRSTTAVSTLDVALLAALNVTDEFMKSQQTIEKTLKRSEELIQLIDGRIGR